MVKELSQADNNRTTDVSGIMDVTLSVLLFAFSLTKTVAFDKIGSVSWKDTPHDASSDSNLQS